MPGLRERQKQRLRERIYRTAVQLFRERGFRQTTATDTAKAAHVSRGTFFNYYPYKEARRLLAEVLRPLREAGELRKDISLERIARSLADTYLLSALRWSAYTPERRLKDEMLKFLDLVRLLSYTPH